MDLEHCLLKRRSCRRYKDKKVSLELIGALLEAATHAPSAGNLQNWIFIVVEDEEKHERIAQLSLRQQWMTGAPFHIVICNDTSKTKRFPAKGELYGIQNCAAAASYILLKAQELGLGACWVGAFDDEGVKDLLHLPDHLIPEIILTVGYAEEWEKDELPIPAHLLTHFNQYGGAQTWILPQGPFPLALHVDKAAKKQGKILSKGIQHIKKKLRQIK